MLILFVSTGAVRLTEVLLILALSPDLDVGCTDLTPDAVFPSAVRAFNTTTLAVRGYASISPNSQ
jgi:hypothetical protein